MNSLLYSNKRHSIYFECENMIFDFCSSFCFYYCFMLFVFYNRYEVNQGAFEPVKYLLSAALFFVVYMIFDKVNNLYFAVVAATAILILTVCFYPVSGMHLLNAVPMVVYIMFRIYDRRRYQPKLNVWRGYGIVALTGLHIITSGDNTQPAFSSQKCLKLMSIVFVIYLVLFLGLKFIRVLDEYYFNVTGNTNYGHIRRKIIFSKNKSDNAFQNLNTDSKCLQKHIRKSLFLFNTSIVGIGAIIIVVTQYFTNIVTYLFGLLNNVLNGFKLSPVEIEQSQNSARKYDIFVPKGSGNNYERTLMDSGMLRMVFNFIFTIVIIAAIVYFVRLIYRKVMGMKKFANDESDEIVNMSEADYDIYRASDAVSKIRYGSSANEQMRRLYRNTIMYLHKKQKIRQLDNKTVKEIEEPANCEVDTKYLQDLSDKYEYARYSNEKISVETLHEMKKLCKQLKI